MNNKNLPCKITIDLELSNRLNAAYYDTERVFEILQSIEPTNPVFAYYDELHSKLYKELASTKAEVSRKYITTDSKFDNTNVNWMVEDFEHGILSVTQA